MDDRAISVVGHRSSVVGRHSKPELLDLRHNAIRIQRLRIVPHGQPRQRRVGGNMLDARQPTERQLDWAGFGGAAHPLDRADVLYDAGHFLHDSTSRLFRQMQCIAKPTR
jgi:hypothetical protein